MIPRLNISFPINEQFRFWFFEKEYSPKDGEFLFNHNRSAITFALRVTLPHGGKVGVLGYNCHTVGNAVLLAGCEPIFVDVDDCLRMDFSSLENKNIDAVVVTHLFGILCDVDSVRNVCPNAIIIEDCAHAYGIIRKIKGDFATYSIGSAKLPSIGDGGILVCKNEVYIERIKTLYNELPEYSCIQEMKLFIRMVLMHWLYKPYIYSMLTKPILKRDKKVKTVRVNEPMLRMSHGIRKLYAYVMMHREDMIVRQITRQKKQLECICHMLMGNVNVERVLSGKNAFMAVVVCKDPIILKQKMASIGVETETHFRHTIDWAMQLGYKHGDCPKAEYMVKHLLMIPTYREF